MLEKDSSIESIVRQMEIHLEPLFFKKKNVNSSETTLWNMDWTNCKGNNNVSGSNLQSKVNRLGYLMDGRLLSDRLEEHFREKIFLWSKA